MTESVVQDAQQQRDFDADPSGWAWMSAVGLFAAWAVWALCREWRR